LVPSNAKGESVSLLKPQLVSNVCERTLTRQSAELEQAPHQHISKPATKRCDVAFETIEEWFRLQGSRVWLIDVRDRRDVARDGMIPNSVNVPLGELKAALLADCEDFDLKYGFEKPEKHHEKVVFYSINHVKSATAVEIAHRLGYRYTRHYSGGYEDWLLRELHGLNIR